MTDAPLPPRPYLDNPACWLGDLLRQREIAAINPALHVEVVGFVRYRGDWLGAIVTPAALTLCLLPGGGELWGDIPAGQRRYVELPTGSAAFLAEDDPHIGSLQQYPLVETISAVPDMATARLIASDMLKLLGFVAPAGTPSDAKPPVSRRGFFRRLAGKS